MIYNQIIVIGAGVVGKCFGALLSKHNNVILIDNPKVVKKINANGITIIDKTKHKFYPTAKSALSKMQQKSLIILATKAHQSVSAIKPYIPMINKNTTILVLQNGLGNKEIVKKTIKNKVLVVRSILNCGILQISDTKFQMIMRDTVLEPTDESENIVRLFNKSQLPSRISNNFSKELWQKLVLNCVINPLTAILRVRNCEIGRPGLKNIRHNIVKECLAVAKTQGVILPKSFANKLDKLIPGYYNFSSMYNDIMNHNKTEIDFLNGKIVELGKKHNIPTPYNQMLTDIIKTMETN